MNHYLFKLCFLALCTFQSSNMVRAQTASAQTTPDAWDRVLAGAGLTRQTARFDFADMGSYVGNDFLLPFFDAMHREPLRIPFYARVVKADFTSAAPSAGELAMAASWRMGEGTRRTLIGDPIAKEKKLAAEPNALLNAIKKIHATSGKPLNASQTTTLTNAIKAVPADIAQNAALLIYTELRALQWRNRALSKWRKTNGANLEPLFKKLIGVNPGDREEWDDSVEELMHLIDLKYLLVGGIDLSLAADEATSALGKRTGTEKFNFDWDTPLGRIALRGAQDDKYPKQPFLLIIDSAGNDAYSSGGATHSAAHPTSVLLDLQGDDRYHELPQLASTPVATFEGRKAKSAQPVFGSGVLGYGVLIDVNGNDSYRSLTNTQGRGLFGLGILHDRAGDDRYDCYTGGQGAANFGVGVLGDVAGKDEYLCFTTSQGFGSTKGCGVLVDTGTGDDRYEANDTVLDFPSPQDANHNATLAQGAGFGRRADYSDGHSLAGGIGALVDGGGKNNFSCGVYGQGTGYWYGAGILCAGEGDDTYRGVWYVQGAIAHFAVGMLWDAGGNDSYKATHNMAMGAGHDFGTGFLFDENGNDRYEPPNLSLGGGNANGFGFFWDKAGDDTYVVGAGATLGRGNPDPRPFSLRDRNITMGIFLDTGGKDTYPTAVPYARDNALWTVAENNPPPNPFVRGAGLDTEDGAKLE